MPQAAGPRAKSKLAGHDLPFSVRSLPKPADFPVAEGTAGDISHEGLRTLLGQEGVSFQRIKTWKASKDPCYREKKARIGHLYTAAGPDRRTWSSFPKMTRPAIRGRRQPGG